jgi:putative endonuclease
MRSYKVERAMEIAAARSRMFSLTLRGKMNWQVYIILCSDSSFYTGITTDMARRFRQHAEGKGAKYFRGRQPVKVMLLEGGHTRSSAGTREAKVKALSHTAKMQLIEEVAQQNGDSRPRKTWEISLP